MKEKRLSDAYSVIWFEEGVWKIKVFPSDKPAELFKMQCYYYTDIQILKIKVS